MKYKHTQTIKSCPIDNATLAKEVGDLYYDSLALFLAELAKKLKSDADADSKRGRKKLANALYQASKDIESASKEIEKAWEICEPFVKEWLVKNGSNRKDF